MSQAELVQQAKHGNVEAIAQLLQLALYTRSVQVKVHRAAECLQVLLEADPLPERQHLVAFIQRTLTKLNLPGIRTVELYARNPGATQFLWCDGFDIKANQALGSEGRKGEALAAQMAIPTAGKAESRDSSSGDSGSGDDQGMRLPETRDPEPEAMAEMAALVQLEPAEIVKRLRSGAVKAPVDQMRVRSARSKHSHDLGWMLVDRLKGMNPFAVGLMTLLTLHSLLGSHHYTPEGFMAGRDPMMMFLHNINLIFHEAGHTLFRPFGEFLMLLGGSLFQVLMPAGLVGYFFVTRQRYAGAIALWWVGQNLLDVSFYIKDAQERALPLLGGEAVLHDWHFLLIKLNLLPHDDAIAGLVFSLGILVYLVAIALGFYFARNPSQTTAH